MNRSHIISGVIFSSTNSSYIVNRNGRIYSKDAMEKAIIEYEMKIRIKQRKEKLLKLKNI